MSACTVTWTEQNVQLRHGYHECVFNTEGEHTRHECSCGLTIVWDHA